MQKYNKKHISLLIMLSLGAICIYKFHTQAMDIADLLNPSPQYKVQLHSKFIEAVKNDHKSLAFQYLTEGVDVGPLPPEEKNKLLRWLEETPSLLNRNYFVIKTINAGANPQILSEKFKLDSIIEAIKQDKIGLVEFWIYAGVNPNARELHADGLPGNHLLFIAYDDGSPEIVKLLLKYNAHHQILDAAELNDIKTFLEEEADEY